MLIVQIDDMVRRCVVGYSDVTFVSVVYGKVICDMVMGYICLY